MTYLSHLRTLAERAKNAHWSSPDAARYIAALSPATVLALLAWIDELAEERDGLRSYILTDDRLDRLRATEEVERATIERLTKERDEARALAVHFQGTLKEAQWFVGVTDERIARLQAVVDAAGQVEHFASKAVFDDGYEERLLVENWPLMDALAQLREARAALARVEGGE